MEINNSQSKKKIPQNVYTQRSKQTFPPNDGEQPFETLKNENTHNQNHSLWTNTLKTSRSYRRILFKWNV